MIAAIVLAAGESKRLGQLKQRVELASETLLGRTVRTAIEADCTPIIVVLGAHHEAILANIDLRQATMVINAAWHEGMASSIRLGLEAVPKTAEGALLLACDQPAVTASHLRLLTASGNITASAYADRRGVPAYLPASSFPDLMKLEGDAGARNLLRHAAAIELPNGELDVDTPTDLAEAKRLFG